MTDSTALGTFDERWLFPLPFSHWRSGSPRALSPLNIKVYLDLRDSSLRRGLDDMHDFAEASSNAFNAIDRLLTTKSSLLVRDSKVSNLDLLFGHGKDFSTSASFAIVFPWLLAASRWEVNIWAFDKHLEQLSNRAMAKPSLKTFRPIPTLRQNVADMRDAIQRMKDEIGKSDTTAFTRLQEILGHELEPLDSMFNTLLKRTNALSAKASNEIQLVIGSVTIQVSFSH